MVLLVAWLFRANRRESRSAYMPRPACLIQHRLVEQRDEFDNIFCSIRDGLITYDTDLRIHFVQPSVVTDVGTFFRTYTSRFYEGQMAAHFQDLHEWRKHPAGLVEESTYRKETYFYSEKAFMQENHQGTYFPVSGE